MKTSISKKIIVSVVLALIIVMSVGTYLLCRRQSNFFTKQMQQEGDILANSVGLGLSKLMEDSFNDKEYIQKMTEELGKIVGIEEIVVYDKEGVVIADTDRAWLGQKREFEDVKQVLATKKAFVGIERIEGKELYSKTFPIFIEKQGQKEFVGIGEVSMDLEEVAKALTVEQQTEIFASIVELNLKKIMGDDISTHAYIQKLTEELGRGAGVYEIMLTDKQLKIIANTHPEEVGKVWAGEDIEEYRKVLADGQIRKYYEAMEKGKAFSITQPIYVEKEARGREIAGLVEVAMSVPYIQSLIASTRNEIIILAIFIILAISIVTIWLLRRSVILPILSLAGVTKVIAKGDLSKRAEVKSKDEIGELATSFNQMSDEIQRRNEELQTMNEELRSTNEELETSNEELQSTTEELEASNEELQETQQQLIQKEKLAAIGRLASAVGHELRNPLGIIKNAQYYIKSKLGKKDEKVTHHLQIMECEIANCAKIINDLLGFSRTKKPEVSPQDVNSIIEESLSSVTKPVNISVETNLTATSSMVLADREQLKQVFINIIINAFQAMPEGGCLKVNTKLEDDTLGIDFQDTGFGISEENLDKLFDPFFTTKARGIGLGLSVCKNIIQNHNGEIVVNSKVGEGSTFTVKLPKGGKNV